MIKLDRDQLKFLKHPEILKKSIIDYLRQGSVTIKNLKPGTPYSQPQDSDI